MKLIPVISPRPGGRRVRRMPPLAIIAASLSVLFPLGAAALASPAAAGTDGFPPADPATFAEWMSRTLRREGLTQEAAARQLGVSVKTVSRWVGGATEPRMRDLRRIQEVFGETPLR